MIRPPAQTPRLTEETEAFILDWLREKGLYTTHMEQVAFLSLELFRELQPLHEEQPRIGQLLHAGALAHDCGYAVTANRHHKHARDLILREPFPGFNQEEIAVIASLARYHRKSPPSTSHALFKQLSKPLRRSVRTCTALLRIADGLDRSHQSLVQGIQARLQPDSVILSLRAPDSIDIDLWGARRKRAYFEELFGLRLRLEVLPPGQETPGGNLEQ